MTHLNQLALTFCKEVLGWENCEEAIHRCAIYHQDKDGIEGLLFTDLNWVMEYVYGWCEANEYLVQINISKGWRSVIICPKSKPISQSSVAGSPCLKTALLTACIEANRRMNAG